MKRLFLFIIIPVFLLMGNCTFIFHRSMVRIRKSSGR
jgi:hypothetical protein